MNRNKTLKNYSTKMTTENTTEDHSDDDEMKLALEISLMESYEKGLAGTSTSRNDTIEISDEYDSMCSDNNSSALSLRERLTNNPTTDTSIVILSDTSPQLDSHMVDSDEKKRFVGDDFVTDSEEDNSQLSAFRVKKDSNLSKTNLLREKMNKNSLKICKQEVKEQVIRPSFLKPKQEAPVQTRGASSTRHLSSNFDSDQDQTAVVIKNNCDRTKLEEKINFKSFLQLNRQEAPVENKVASSARHLTRNFCGVQGKGKVVIKNNCEERFRFEEKVNLESFYKLNKQEAPVGKKGASSSRPLSSNFDTDQDPAKVVIKNKCQRAKLEEKVNLKSFSKLNKQEASAGSKGASSSRHLSSNFDNDQDQGKMKTVLNSNRETVKEDVNDVPHQSSRALSTEEVAARMRTVFESGLSIHFSGEVMEACKAVSTSLFPHQQVALAWMCRHENKETDGMRGGILADDMGLGKTLTVISLIMTNFWDGKPMAKPELGYTRPPFNIGPKGPGMKKNAASSLLKVCPDNAGVGRKMIGGGKKKTSIGGLFSKFNVSDSDKENKSSFKFKKKVESKRHFIDDSSDSSDNAHENSEVSDDEFDKMMSTKSPIFKLSAKDLFKKEEIVSEDDYSSSEERMHSMIPTKIDFEPKLNTDGFLDSSEDENTGKSLIGNKKRKANSSDTNIIRNSPVKKLKTGHPVEIPDDESDTSLPEVFTSTSVSPSSGIGFRELGGTSSNSPDMKQVELEKTAGSGQKVIIPPKEPAVRDGRRRATLIICPASLIGHWVEQFHQHLHKSVNIKLKIHHGQNKSMTGADLESYDIVITTYGTLASEGGAMEITPLIRAKWLRVVMDEGHTIKNHISKSAKAAMSLDTIRRWIVSGTPIQNNLMELWSLVNWLNFGMYCGKSQMKVFKGQIERPCKNGDPVGFERLQVLLDTICLRRTKTDKKQDGSPLVVLPRKTIVAREVEMTDEERLCYAIFQKHAQEIVGRYHKRGELLRNYAHVFALMMRMRQLCCHREIIKDVDWEKVLEDKEGLSSQLEEFLENSDVTNVQDGTDEPGTNMAEDVERKLVNQLREMIRSGVSDDCSVCLDDLKTPVITPCAHVFCRLCIERVLETIKPPSCPLCRSKIDSKKLLLEAGQDEEEDERGEASLADMEDIVVKVSSSKVNAVLKEMLRIQRDCPDDKIVVVSQFTSFLNILQPLIKDNNFSMVRLDGTMSHIERSETVGFFQSRKKESPKVMLLSLKAGGVGLNLTAANHLLLLDPAWNPASEWQCFDRTHRLGQKKEVTIYKYITKNSIEEKMMEIQDKKKDLISGAFHMPAEERRRQRVNDIRNIFGI